MTEQDEIKQREVMVVLRKLGIAITNSTAVTLSEAEVISSVSVRYALEVPQGWFTKQGVKIGDTFSIMTDILTEKLKQHPDLVQGITERGGLEYLQKSEKYLYYSIISSIISIFIILVSI